MSLFSSTDRFDHLFTIVENEFKVGSDKGDPSESDVKVSLDEDALWTKFRELTNEMIVTKTGRRMFPVLKVNITGLDPNSMYSVLLDFVAADENRWKYVNGEWIPGGKPEPQSPSCVYIHSESPNFGAHWMKAPVSFNKVKLSNKLNGGGQVMLNSLHKYEARVHIVKVGGTRKMVASRSFPETQFIAVTAYQNEAITALKIKHNPFAKAFLDAKERRDHKDALDNLSDGQQTGYSQIGSWFLPSNGTLCSPINTPSLAGEPLSSGHGSYCERYSGLRNQRASPYPSPYSQRNASPNSYIENPPSSLSVISTHDGWSGLNLSASSGVLPISASNASSTGQYPSLWSISSNTLCPTSQSSSTSTGLPSQLLRSSSVSYTSLSSAVPAPAVSPLYEGSLAEVTVGEGQYDSCIARLTSSWAPVTQTY
ncbi:T-box transcription factor T-A-like [Protopterus annectens]|uniref:T-box transcription factor T-A-like n=1 Tax=Protopterus annectens TaxID=7888 RepID=UPI001CFA1AD8|nr:T-box transcription factor T-A-like [Protopterus annectens]